LAVLFLQFLIIWLVEAASSRRKKPRALPELPNCRCGGSLKSTRRGKGYLCRSCSRLYQFASGSNEHFKFVEKLATGYTLAYLKTEKGQAWVADIPLCRCGSAITVVSNQDGVDQYFCSSCDREYGLVSELGKGVWFKEKMDSHDMIPYMKSIRWDMWEPDEGCRN